MNPLAFIQNQQQPYNGNPLAALQSLIMNQGQAPQDPFGGQIPMQTPQPNQYGWDQLRALDQIDAQEPSYLDYGQGVMPSPQANYDNTPMGNQMNAGGPQLPVQSNKNTATIIQQQLGALPQSQPDTVSNILSGRFNQQDEMGDMSGMGGGTSYGDYSQGIVSSALGKPAIGPQFAEARQGEIMKQLIAMKKLEQLAAGGGGNSVYSQVMRQIESDPTLSKLDMATKISLAKSGMGQGATIVDGQIQGIGGYTDYKGGIKGAEQDAKNASDMASAAEIERQKIIGKGEITPQAQLAKGQTQVTKVIGDMGKAYDELNLAGGAVNTQKGALANSGAYLGNTATGQFMGKLTGSDVQSKRNQIEQTRPLLINAIRQATGMSAKSMDSNAELQFYLNAATNPKLDIQANKIALKRLDELYGLSANGGGNQQPSGQEAVDYREYFK